MSQSSDRFDTADLRLPDGMLRGLADPTNATNGRLVCDRTTAKMVPPDQLPAARNPKFKFCQWPMEGLGLLCANERDATLAVLVRLTELWFSGFKRNPVKLASVEIKGFKVSKDQKARALRALEKAGLISVERRSRKSPIVTLNWLPLL